MKKPTAVGGYMKQGTYIREHNDWHLIGPIPMYTATQLAALVGFLDFKIHNKYWVEFAEGTAVYNHDGQAWIYSKTPLNPNEENFYAFTQAVRACKQP
jgi:hypothetical protein